MRTQLHLRDRPPVARGAAVAAAAALFGIAAVHLIDGPRSLDDQFYVGVLELALSAACVPLAVMLLMRPTRYLWLSAAILVCVALVFFAASRTIGLPGSTADIGNWGESLGIVNLIAELALISSAGWALLCERAQLPR
jgi:hypothetical protein